MMKFGIGILVTTLASTVASAKERTISVETIVNASIDDVWTAWTTSEGVASFGPLKAKVELRVGGPFEWYFAVDAPEGSRGSEGCKIVSYVPKRMLSFTWNAPPKIPNLRNAGAKTAVVVLFDELAPNRVKVTLTQLITEEGPDWDQYYEYFNNAWPRVLKALGEKFSPPNQGTNEQQGLQPLGRLIGEWVAKGTWEDPNSGGIRVTHEWGLNGKILKSKSYIAKDGDEQNVYETISTWHPQKKTIVFQSFSVWGSLYDGVVELKDPKTLEFNWTDYSGDQTRTWRQTMTFENENTYTWKVFQKTDAGWKLAKESEFQKVRHEGT